MRCWTKRLIACAALLFAAAPAWALSPFIVFFDSGSARISPATSATLDNAAAFIRNVDVREIEITGSADRAGSDRVNLELSRRRAEAVRAALLEKGMSRHVRVRIVAAGETQPIVRTGDGVAQAENRNVVILLSHLCSNADSSRVHTPECDTPLPD